MNRKRKKTIADLGGSGANRVRKYTKIELKCSAVSCQNLSKNFLLFLQISFTISFIEKSQEVRGRPGRGQADQVQDVPRADERDDGAADPPRLRPRWRGRRRRRQRGRRRPGHVALRHRAPQVEGPQPQRKFRKYHEKARN